MRKYIKIPKSRYATLMFLKRARVLPNDQLFFGLLSLCHKIFCVDCVCCSTEKSSTQRAKVVALDIEPVLTKYYNSLPYFKVRSYKGTNTCSVNHKGNNNLEYQSEISHCKVIS